MTVNGFDLLIGSLLPLLVGFLSKCSWPGWVKSGIAMVAAFIAAAVRLQIETGNVFNNLEAFAVAFPTILIAAGASYQLILKELAKKLQQSGPISDPAPANPAIATNS